MTPHPYHYCEDADLATHAAEDVAAPDADEVRRKRIALIAEEVDAGRVTIFPVWLTRGYGGVNP